MKRIAKGALALAGALAAVGATSPGAYANDLLLDWTNNAGYHHQGRYTDLTDTLCARTQGQDETVKMVPTNGSGSTYSVSAKNVNVGTYDSWKCTGNLSIPEDKQYRMEIWVSSRPGGPKDTLVKSQTFYS